MHIRSVIFLFPPPQKKKTKKKKKKQQTSISVVLSAVLCMLDIYLFVFCIAIRRWLGSKHSTAGQTTAMELGGGAFLYRKQLQCILSQKYLGVIIEDGNCEADTKSQLMNLYANGNTLVRKFGKCSCNVKLELFRMYCTNLYCGIFCIMPLRKVWIHCMSQVMI